MKKSVSYVRVSSKEQEQSGYSLPAQRKFLEEYASRKELVIEKVFEISESASGKKQRQVFSEMLSYVDKNQIKIILCEKVDRFTRNLRDAVRIDDWLGKDSERELHLVKNSIILNKNSRSQEKLNWGLQVLLAKNYSDNLSEEIQKGCLEKAEQGWYPHLPPIGYKSITRDENNHKIIIQDDKIAPLLKKSFELYATGDYSVLRVRDLMYKEGLRSRFGNKIPLSKMHELLSNPFYYGEFTWKGKTYQGKYEPLISKDLFEKVQNIIHGKKTPKYQKHFFAFRGMIKCYECGGKLTWERKKGITYGRCTSYRQCPRKKFLKEKDIEEKITAGIKDLKINNPHILGWVREALKEGHNSETIYHSTALEELNNRLKLLQRRLDGLYDDKLDGKIELAFYEKKNKEYTDEKEQVIDSIKKHSEASNKYLELGIQIYELSQKADEIYEKAKPEYKRQLVNLVFEELKVEKEEFQYSYSEPFKLIYEMCRSLKSSKMNLTEEFDIKIFTPQKIGSNNENNSDFATTIPSKWTWGESNSRAKS